MEVTEFFTLLHNSFSERRMMIHPNDRFKQTEENQKIETALGHVNMLVNQASAPQARRTMSVIRSSWKIVKSIGSEFEFFEKFRGNSELRVALLNFLNGKDG